jgi:hypothetical protein
MRAAFATRLIWLTVLVVLIGAVGLAVVTRPEDAAGPCVVVQRTTSLRQVPEASGLAVSRRTPGILWSHNDSGHATVLFALDASGALRGQVRVPIETQDWEDVSSGSCPGGECLYIADIGDNGLSRHHIRIFRLPEPSPDDTETAPPEVFNASYTDGRHNAEALFVVGTDLFIVTRDRTGALYRAALPPSGATNVAFERIGQLDLAAVTDAETTRDARSVVVRTSHEAVVYRTVDIVRGGAVPAGFSIPIDGLKEAQGEGVALDGNMLYLVSEGRPWRRAGRFLSLRCTLP